MQKERTDKEPDNKMRQPLGRLNKAFESRIRIGIMSALMVNENMNFNNLKHLTKSTDGNLATHLKTLEEGGLITMQKGFIGRKTNTLYTITRDGENAFKAHIDALEELIKTMNSK